MFPPEEIIKIVAITFMSFICSVGWGFLLKKKGKMVGFNTTKEIVYFSFAVALGMLIGQILISLLINFL